MKKVSLIFLIVSAPLFLKAQDSVSGNFPYWTVSKGVQQYANRNIAYAPRTFDITDLSALVSKNIHRKQVTATKPATLGTYPTWTISKPVARQAAEKRDAKKAGSN